MDNSYIKKQSQQFTLDAVTYSYKFAHGLGYVPKKVWAEMICINADANLSTNVGDALDLETSSDFEPYPFYSVYADANYAEIACNTPFVGQEASLSFVCRGGGSNSQPNTWANFVLVIYVM
jgi:hypothetical protein